MDSFCLENGCVHSSNWSQLVKELPSINIVYIQKRVGLYFRTEVFDFVSSPYTVSISSFVMTLERLKSQVPFWFLTHPPLDSELSLWTEVNRVLHFSYSFKSIFYYRTNYHSNLVDLITNPSIQCTFKSIVCPFAGTKSFLDARRDLERDWSAWKSGYCRFFRSI